jgi:hypothetical protein
VGTGRSPHSLFFSVGREYGSVLTLYQLFMFTGSFESPFGLWSRAMPLTYSFQYTLIEVPRMSITAHLSCYLIKHRLCFPLWFPLLHLGWAT